MSDYAILAPIVFLFALGAFIALRSGSGVMAGPRQLSTGEGELRLVAGNFSAMFVRVLGYLVLLIVVQSAIGFPTLFIW